MNVTSTLNLRKIVETFYGKLFTHISDHWICDHFEMLVNIQEVFESWLLLMCFQFLNHVGQGCCCSKSYHFIWFLEQYHKTEKVLYGLKIGPYNCLENCTPFLHKNCDDSCGLDQFMVCVRVVMLPWNVCVFSPSPSFPPLGPLQCCSEHPLFAKWEKKALTLICDNYKI